MPYVKMQYIGQTGDSIQKKFFGHKGSINHKNLSEDIGRHFNLPGHHGLSDIQITVLDIISNYKNIYIYICVCV